jgi:two-component system response regulator FixJ
MKPTIFLVDDDPAFRASVHWLLEAEGMTVEAFPSAEDFLARFDDTNPGCLLLDVRMAGMSGLDLQEQLRARQANLPVIIVTAHGDVPLAVRAMKAGAVDFIEKPFERKVLLDSIRLALEREDQSRARAARRADARARLAQLTERERQVLALVVEGSLSKQVAARLGISTRTVETHRANIMRKVGVASLPNLVRLALDAES